MYDDEESTNSEGRWDHTDAQSRPPPSVLSRGIINEVVQGAAAARTLKPIELAGADFEVQPKLSRQEGGAGQQRACDQI